MCKERHYLQVQQVASYVWNMDISPEFSETVHTNNAWDVFQFGSR